MSVGALNLMGSSNPMKELLEKQKNQIEDLMNPQKLPAEMEAPAVEMAQAAQKSGDVVSLSSRQTSQQILAESGSSMMSRSFAHGGEAADNMSSYLQAQMEGARAAENVAQIQQKAVVSFLGAVGVSSPGTQTETAAGAGKAVRSMSNKQNSEAGERNLDEIKEKLDEKTKEVTAPKDASGNPIQVGPEAAELSTPATPASPATPAAPEMEAVGEMVEAAPVPAAPSLDLFV